MCSVIMMSPSQYLSRIITQFHDGAWHDLNNHQVRFIRRLGPTDFGMFVVKLQLLVCLKGYMHEEQCQESLDHTKGERGNHASLITVEDTSNIENVPVQHPQKYTQIQSPQVFPGMLNLPRILLRKKAIRIAAETAKNNQI